MDRIAELEAKRAERKAEIERARLVQYEQDLLAVEAIEQEKGEDLDISLRVGAYRPGLPTLVGVRAPDATEYKRYFQQVNKAGENVNAKLNALELLAESCWAYPADPEIKKSMKAAHPGLVASIAVKAIKLAELHAEEEGKG